MEEEIVGEKKPFRYEKQCRFPELNNYNETFCAIPLIEAEKLGIRGFYNKIYCRNLDNKQVTDMGSIMSFMMFVGSLFDSDNKNLTVIVYTNNQDFVALLDAIVEKIEAFKKK